MDGGRECGETDDEDEEEEEEAGVEVAGEEGGCGGRNTRERKGEVEAQGPYDSQE